MGGRTSLNGHQIYFDNEFWRYVDSDEIADMKHERSCVKCGKLPTDNGDDFCISNLGYVTNACCGHGIDIGYIQFDDGTIIRGYFEIERPEG